MKHTDPLLSAARSVRRSFNADGLPEILNGCVLLLTALFLFVRELLPKPSPWRTFVAVGFAAVVIGIFLLSQPLLNAVKSRVSCPRTGFVQFAGYDLRVHLVGLGSAVALVLLLLAVRATTLSWIAWVVVITGLVLGLVLAFEGYVLGLRRFYLLAAFSLVAGVTLAVSKPPHAGNALAAYFTAMGAAVTLSGLFTLRRFLRQPRAAEEEAP